MAKVFADNVVLDLTVSGVCLFNLDKTIRDTGGNNNGELDPGETAGITVLLKNYGTSSATNTNGTLQCSSPYISINDNYGYWGTIASGDSLENVANPFTVTVSPTTPLGEVINFTLLVNATGGYQDTFTFNVIIGGQGFDYVTHDCGNIKLSMTRFGTLGYMSAYAPNPGDGFTFPITSASHLFYGTFAAGNAATYCNDRYFKGGSCEDDWHTTNIPDGTIRMYEPGPDNRDEYTSAHFDDSGHPSARGLTIHQTSWAWNDATANDFAIVLYVLKNNGSTTLSNMYAALFMDWDVGLATSNQGSSDLSRKLTWIYQTTPYVGVAILDPPRGTPAANLAMVSHQDYVYPLNGLPDSILIRFMNGTIQQPSTDTTYDWTACNSTGPFTLAPGDTFAAAFAVLGGTNLVDLQMNADTAYNRYWNMIGTAENKNLTPTSRFKVYPAISKAQPYTVSYNLSIEVPLQIKVFNTLGQVVAQESFGLVNGIGEIMLDLKAHTQGVYFINIEAGDLKQTNKIILLK